MSAAWHTDDDLDRIAAAALEWVVAVSGAAWLSGLLADALPEEWARLYAFDRRTVNLPATSGLVDAAGDEPLHTQLTSLLDALDRRAVGAAVRAARALAAVAADRSTSAALVAGTPPGVSPGGLVRLLDAADRLETA